MIFLIIAIVVGLILFSLLRTLFFPFLIVMGIGFLIHHFNGGGEKPQYVAPTQQAPVQITGNPHQAKTKQNLDIAFQDVQISHDQKMICRYISDASQSFLILEEEWNKSDSLDNKIATKIAHEPLKSQIEKILKERNENIFSYLGRKKPKIKKWKLYVEDYTYTDGDEGGIFTANLISPCEPKILVKIFMYTPKKNDLPVLATISNGSIIEVSGTLLPKYADEGLTPDNIEWGGTHLWGDYGDLAGHDVFQSPEFDISPTSFSIPLHH